MSGKRKNARCGVGMKPNGFTLVELLIVVAVMGLITTFLIINFRGSRLAVDQAAAVLEGELRDLQRRAIAAAPFQDAAGIPRHRCGYGVAPVDNKEMITYTSPDASDPVNPGCDLQNRDYESGIDFIVKRIQLINSTVEFKLTGATVFFDPVFFEPPDPKTYVNNDASPGIAPSQILLGPRAINCTMEPLRCWSLCVYTSGKIESVSGTNCP